MSCFGLGGPPHEAHAPLPEDPGTCWEGYNPACSSDGCGAAWSSHQPENRFVYGHAITDHEFVGPAPPDASYPLFLLHHNPWLVEVAPGEAPIVERVRMKA